ncbi:MAG TPA: hypothetical protein VMF31_06160, partial [Solirubrobacterales bacterium]|nr:hypothetical protein [Solirubrobacterales bacterium]
MSPGKPGGFFGGIAAAAARRAWPVLTLGLLIVALAVAAVAASGMKVQPVTDAIFNRDSAAYKDTAAAEKKFGGEPVVILAKGDLAETLKPDNLKKLNTLEQCVAGGISRGRGELFKICERIAEIDPVVVATRPA